jgi:hypothetical protein
VFQSLTITYLILFFRRESPSPAHSAWRGHTMNSKCPWSCGSLAGGMCLAVILTHVWILKFALMLELVCLLLLGYFVQADLELLKSSDPPASASRSWDYSDHHAQLLFIFVAVFFFCVLLWILSVAVF